MSQLEVALIESEIEMTDDPPDSGAPARRLRRLAPTIRLRWRAIQELKIPFLARVNSLFLTGSNHEVNIETKGRLVVRLNGINAPIVRYLIAATVLFVVGLIAGSWTIPIYDEPGHYSSQYWTVTVVVGFCLVGIVLFFTAGVLESAKGSILKSYRQILINLDRNESKGLTQEVQRGLNRQLDQIARLILNQPRRVKTRNQKVVRLALSKAAGVLDLHEWVSTPLDENTYAHLKSRIRTDFVTYLMRGWHSLPDPQGAEQGEILNRRSAISVVPWVAVAFAGVSSVVLAATFSDKLGIATQFVVLAGLLIAILGLLKAGIPIAQIKEAIDVVKSAKGAVSQEE